MAAEGTLRSNGAVTLRLRATTSVVLALLTLLALVPTAQTVAAAEDAPTGLATWNQAFVDLPTTALVYDAPRGTFLVTVPGRDPSLGNELVEIDPETGAIGRHVYVGSEPSAIALADDGVTAYVGFDGASEIVRVDLPSLTVVDRFQTGYEPFYGYFYVEDLAVQPGHPDTVVASIRRHNLEPDHHGVWVFRDGVRLADHSDTYGVDVGNRIEFTDPDTVIAVNDHYSTRVEPMELQITATGATKIRGSFDPPFGWYGDIEAHDGVLFTTSGYAVDPAGPTALVHYGHYSAYWGNQLVEVFPSFGLVAYLHGNELQQYSGAGVLLDSRSFDFGGNELTAMVASPDSLAFASPAGLYLLGPNVTQIDVTKPTVPASTIDDLELEQGPSGAANLTYDDTRDGSTSPCRATSTGPPARTAWTPSTPARASSSARSRCRLPLGDGHLRGRLRLVRRTERRAHRSCG